jgi:hypothetical protein
MIITTIVVLVALLALSCLLWFAQSQAAASKILENPVEHIRTVDVEAFQNLVDPDEEEFLRKFRGNACAPPWITSPAPLRMQLSWFGLPMPGVAVLTSRPRKLRKNWLIMQFGFGFMLCMQSRDFTLA